MELRDKLEYGKNPGEIRQLLEQGCNDSGVEECLILYIFR